MFRTLHILPAHLFSLLTVQFFNDRDHLAIVYKKKNPPIPSRSSTAKIAPYPSPFFNGPVLVSPRSAPVRL